MSEPTANLSPDFAIKILDHAPQGVILSDANGNISWCNQTLGAWLSLSPAAICGTQLASFIQQHLTASEDEPDSYVVTADNSPERWLRQTTMRVDMGGTLQDALFFSDIGVEYKLREKLDQLETIEPVSRLLNRRAMLQNLEPLISRSRRYDNPLSVISMELLNLNALNDQYGEAAANHAVLELSHLLKDQLRWADIISRTDDNHIIIILPETSKDDAGRLAEKINANVAELQIHYEAIPKLNLQACYGVAAWAKGNDSLLLLRNANQAMSKAREQGTGNVVVV